MRQPLKYPFASRLPAHASNETETVLVMACAMIAIFVAVFNADTTTVIGFFH